MNLPIKSSHCRTTHTACECILDNMNKLEAVLRIANDALKITFDEVENFYTKSEQESRIQTIHSDDHSLWYARDMAYEVLQKIKETLGEK